MRMKNKILLLLGLLLGTSQLWAAKSIYIPNEWRNSGDSLLYKESDPNNQYTWSKSRSIESDNVIVFWDKGYGSTKPNQLSTSSAYYVDINTLLNKCEEYYELECSTLGFVDPDNSNISTYKVMVLLNHTTDWVCYGGGYDFQVPALWLGPSSCVGGGNAAVAHEVGHSFHYMCYSEDSNHGANSSIQTGFHGAVGNGAAIWETTANWQALQSYPNEWFTESYMTDVLQKTHNYAWSHEWHRYQAYPFLTYLVEKYGDVKTVANVWNYRETTVKDFNEVLMDYKGLTANQLYAMYYEYASKMATYDFSTPSSYWSSSYVGKFNYNCIKTADNTYQVAYSSCPQSTGFNVVPLTVPSAGTTVSIDFTALAPGSNLLGGDPKQYVNGETVYTTTTATKYNSATYASRRGFRVGFVAYLRNGTRQYFGGDQVICTGTGEVTSTVSCTVPTNTTKLYMIVVPALTSYIQHKWDENISNDDMWPYRFKINNTTLGSAASVTNVQETTEGDTEIRTYTYEVERYINKGYSSQTVNIADMSNALSWLGISDVSSATIYFINGGDGSKIENAMATYDGWCDDAGNAVTWGSSAYLCAKFTPATSSELLLCTMPGNDGTPDVTYTATWALYYASGSTKKQVNFTFNVTMVEPPAFDISEYTLVNTYSVETTVKAASNYETTSLSLSGVLTDLSVSSLIGTTFCCEMEDGELSSQSNGGAYGFWLNSEGKKCDWGDAASRFYVDIDESNLLVGQYPGKCEPGYPYMATLYFLSESAQQYVKVDLTYNITPLQLSDFTVVGSYNFYVETDTVKLDYSVDSIALDVAAIQTALALDSLTNTKFYATRGEGEITAAYTANNGYYLNASGYPCPYGEEQARFFVETDKTQLKIGQKPGTCALGDTYTATFYIGDEETSKLVALNLTYKIKEEPVGLAILVQLIQDALDGNATLSQIEEMVQKIMAKDLDAQ